MTEVAVDGEGHGYALFVGSGYDLVVADGAAGRYDGGDAGLGEHVEAVTEGEEGISCSDGAFRFRVMLLKPCY